MKKRGGELERRLATAIRVSTDNRLECLNKEKDTLHLNWLYYYHLLHNHLSLLFTITPFYKSVLHSCITHTWWRLFSRNCCVIKVLFSTYSKHVTLSDLPFLCLDRQTDIQTLPPPAQVVRAGLEQGPVQGYEAESNGFAELGMTSESKALKSIFFGQVNSSLLFYSHTTYSLQ